MSLSVNKIDTKAVFTQNFVHSILAEKNLVLDVLRLDKLHPIISGNKLFKLKYYLEDARLNNCRTIKTFGGFYSNHIAATAYAAKLWGFTSLGIFRGQKPEQLTPTLLEAASNGMQFEFVSGEEYNSQKRIAEKTKEIYCIPEGGYGLPGVKGAADICELADDFASYDHIVCGVGTGTTAAGIITSLFAHQKFTGISALKGAYSLDYEIKELLMKKADYFVINHDYHFGGFAKHPAELLAFMRRTWQENNLPTDIVYTAKTLFAVLDLAAKDYFPKGDKILMIHTGGLQGNRSLPADSLPFL